MQQAGVAPPKAPSSKKEEHQASTHLFQATEILLQATTHPTPKMLAVCSHISLKERTSGRLRCLALMLGNGVWKRPPLQRTVVIILKLSASQYAVCQHQ